MAYPTGVSVAVISAGGASTFFGDDASLTARVTPVLSGTNRIVHAATGTLMVPAPMTFTSAAGGNLTFSVPHVDQPGWVDGAGQAYTMWAYKVDVTATFKNGRTSTSQKWSQNFQPLVGQDLIDLDLIGDGPIGAPVSAPLPEVLSVNGQTGAVVIETSSLTILEDPAVPGTAVIG